MRRRFHSILCLAACGLLAGAAVARAADVEIDSNTFGGLEARSLGPAVMSGRIAAIDAVGPDPLTIYVGAAGGGVWKSTDGGLTFKPVFDEHNQSIGAITIDPKNPKNVWVGTGESWTRNSTSVGDGLYKIDGRRRLLAARRPRELGAHRPRPGEPGRRQHGLGLRHRPSVGQPPRSAASYKTTDGGKTWKKVLYVDADTGCSDLAVDPQDPSILYAGMWQFRRTPCIVLAPAARAAACTSRPTAARPGSKLEDRPARGGQGAHRRAVAPSRPNVVYALVEAADTALFRSDDTGESWRQVNNSFNIQVRPFYFAHIVVDPDGLQHGLQAGPDR